LPPRSYFYRDSENNLKKFAYCCMCGAGPFKESEKDYKYLSIGSKNANSYCVSCVKTLKLPQESFLIKSPIVVTETIKEVFYTGMSTVKAPVIGFDYKGLEGEHAQRSTTVKKVKIAPEPKPRASKKAKGKDVPQPLTKSRVNELYHQMPPLFKELEGIKLPIAEKTQSIDLPEPLQEEISDELLQLPSIEEGEEELLPFPTDEDMFEDIPEEEPLQQSVEEDIPEEVLSQPVESIIEETPLPQPVAEEVQTPLPVDEVVEEIHQLPQVEEVAEEIKPVPQEETPKEAEAFSPPPFLIKSNEELLGTQKEQEEVSVPPQVQEEKGPFYTYIGQFSDDTIISDVTNDLIRDVERINSGDTVKGRCLPMEIIFYHINEAKIEAQKAYEAITLMNENQRELLIETFNQNFFKK